MNELRDAALEYARRGWPVFPLFTWRNGACTCGAGDCSSPAKHPLRQLAPNGLKNATTDLDRIDEWWTRFPTANIGLRTEVAFDVLDIDGTEGRDSLDALCEANSDLPAGPTALTGGGGYHCLFLPAGISNRAGLVTKIDWRGRGGYIVAAPSLHASGRNYEWMDPPDTPLSEIPEWLRLVLDPPKPPRPERPPGDRANVSYLAVPGQGTRYGIAALEAELEELGRAVEGTRNHELNAHAYNLYQLVGGGELDEGFAYARLQDAAIGIGLTGREIEGTLRSAKQAGMAAPRYAPTLPPRLQATGTSLVEPWANDEPDHEPDHEPEPDHVAEWVPPPDSDEQPQEPPEPTEPGPKPDLDIDTFLNSDDPEYDWLVPGLLERQDRLIVTGPEGGGKSTLLRQLSIQLAAGIHPFTLDNIDPVRVLFLDLENSARQTRRKIKPLRHQAGAALDADNLRIRIVNQGINLANATHQDWLDRRLEANRPDVLITGPLYKLADGDPTEEKVAKPVAVFLDHMRVKHGIAVILEAHTPHATTPGGRRPERPYGWSGWLRWPEFGIHLSDKGNITHWRGQRDEREWPSLLKRGGEWMWSAVTDTTAVRFADMIAHCRKAGEILSNRKLAEAIGTSEATIRRALESNRNEWENLKREIDAE